MQSKIYQETLQRKSSEMKVKILHLERTITRRNTLKYWFTIEGKKEPTYSLWFEISEREIVEEGCDCIYESNNRFGKEKECKHLTRCRDIVKNMVEMNFGKENKKNNDNKI